MITIAKFRHSFCQLSHSCARCVSMNSNNPTTTMTRDGMAWQEDRQIPVNAKRGGMDVKWKMRHRPFLEGRTTDRREIGLEMRSMLSKSGIKFCVHHFLFHYVPQTQRPSSRELLLDGMKQGMMKTKPCTTSDKLGV